MTGSTSAVGQAAEVSPFLAGSNVYVTDEETRLRAAPSTHSDTLASLERGRWLEVVALGAPLTIAGVWAPWVQVRDPWAPEGDSPFLAPTSGWVWGGLLRPIPETLPAPSVANWERVIVRVDPHSRLLDQTGKGGEAVAWAVHFEPDRDGAPRTLELAEWLRLGAAPTASWRLVGWRRLGRLSILAGRDAITWLRLEGEGNRRQARVLLRPSLLDAPPLDLDGSGRSGQPTATTVLPVDVDGDGTDELAVLETPADSSQVPIQRGLSWFALTAKGAELLGEPVVRGALMPSPNLLVESVAATRAARHELVVVVVVRNEAAGAPASELILRASGRRVVDGVVHRGEPVVSRGQLPALVPDRIYELRFAVPLETEWDGVDLEATVVPVPVEERLDDNRKRITIESL